MRFPKKVDETFSGNSQPNTQYQVKGQDRKEFLGTAAGVSPAPCKNNPLPWEGVSGDPQTAYAPRGCPLWMQSWRVSVPCLRNPQGKRPSFPPGVGESRGTAGRKERGCTGCPLRAGQGHTRRLLLHKPRELARGHLGRDFAQRAPGGAEYPGQGGLQSPEPEGEGQRCIREHREKCAWGLLVGGSLRIPQRQEGCSADVAKPRSPLLRLRLAEHFCTLPLTAPSFSPGAAGRTAEGAQLPAGDKRGKKPPRPPYPFTPPPTPMGSQLKVAGRQGAVYLLGEIQCFHYYTGQNKGIGAF